MLKIFNDLGISIKNPDGSLKNADEVIHEFHLKWDEIK